MNMNRKKTDPAMICFIVVALLSGILFSFLIVPWQTPDEYTHLSLIGAGIKNDQLADTMFEDFSLDANRIYFHPEEKVDLGKLLSGMSAKPGYEKSQCLPRGIRLSILSHLPATIGLEIGVLLGLPTYWTLQCAEIFSLVFYILMGCLTLYLAPPPTKKLFLIIMLMPMGIQQAASINYDSVLLPLCFLFVAWIWHVKAEKKDVGRKEILLWLLILAVIATVKIPYVLISLLILIIPANQVCLKFGKKEFRLKKSVWTGVAIVFFLILLFGCTLYLMRNTDSAQIIFACFGNLKQAVAVLFSTFKQNASHLAVSMVGNFGWMDTCLPFGLVYIYLTLVAVIAATGVRSEKEVINDAKPELSGMNRMVIVIFAVLLSILIALGMINHTVAIFGYDKNYPEVLMKISTIYGLQGRYFIPMVVPVLSLFPEIFKTKEKTMRIITLLVVCSMLLISLLYIYHRYFG